MTSDAKIGLLLGLVFIFIIAFIINGLPNFHKNSGDNDLTTNMVISQDNKRPLGGNERKLTRQLTNNQIRYTTALPKNPRIIRAAEQIIKPLTTEPLAARPVIAAKPTPRLPVKSQQAPKLQSKKKNFPKYYIVQTGDNLSVIAKKFYGKDLGNKKVNVDRIYRVNRSVLKSPEQIYVGQKLVIPALTDRNTAAKKVVLPTAFKKIASGIKKTRPKTAKSLKRYVVQPNDSLWQIAKEKLGNGNRYTEIARMNRSTLEDEDHLVVGVTLKLPAR